MNLRSRLNLLVTCMFLGILLAGTVLVIHNARTSVAKELRSTANLTLQLLEVAVLEEEPGESEHWQQIRTRIAALAQTRHLDIEIQHDDGGSSAVPPRADATLEAAAPSWFVRLVRPDVVEMRQSVTVPGMPSGEIVIRPDPADEISEAWQEARSLLILLAVFFVTGNVTIFIAIGRSLKPLDSILHALEGIERGDYQLRLPQFRLPELQKVARNFNRMAEVLETSREENRFLTKKSLAIQEDERRRLAQELHDEMGQSISAIKALSVSIEQREPDRNIRESASRITDVSTRIYDLVRIMMRRLRPLELDEFGLVSALRVMIDDWNVHHDQTHCRFTSHGDFDLLNDELKIAIYRIVQECLTNAAKHAAASEVRLTLDCHPVSDRGIAAAGDAHLLELAVSDNGRGFDPDMRRHGLGLPGIRERVRSLNGEIRLESSAGTGVRLNMSFPVPAESSSDERKHHQSPAG